MMLFPSSKQLLRKFKMEDPFIAEKFCHVCAFEVVSEASESLKFCPSCGTLLASYEESIIRHYFSKGFQYKSIIQMLDKRHGIKMCERTLRSRLSAFGLSRRLPQYELNVIRNRISQELDGPGCMGGYRTTWHTLRMEGMQVPRRIVEGIVRELDPEGCELRQRKRLRRRKYRAPGPNYVWHLDGYDKIKPIGFPIHGCIDGWSRKIMWLKVDRSNNKPEIPGGFFLDCVQEYGGSPVRVRSDCGTENGIICAMQCHFQENADAHIYGKSPANQRIEGWWSFYRRNRSTWWINYFKDLIEQEIFHPGDALEEEAFWFCFSTLLQIDLDHVKDHWNSHRIRNSGHSTIPGIPDELYYLPENNGGEDGLLKDVSNEEIQLVADSLLQFNEEENDYQDYFNYIVANSSFQMPNDWRGAEEL